MLTHRLWTSPYLLLALTCLFWAGNSVLGRAFHEQIPPITFSFLRWGIALAVVAPWALRPMWSHRRTILARWKIVTFLGVLGVPTYNTINYWALKIEFG